MDLEGRPARRAKSEWTAEGGGGKNSSLDGGLEPWLGWLE